MKKTECEACGFKTICTSYEHNNHETYYLCDICMSTQTSKVILYPNQCNISDVLQAIAYVGNTILEAINK